jgi:hypothetical protein
MGLNDHCWKIFMITVLGPPVFRDARELSPNGAGHAPSTDMKTLAAIMSAALLFLSAQTGSAQSAKDDMKDAGRSAKDAGKNVGDAAKNTGEAVGHTAKKTAKRTKRTAKRGANAAARETEKGANKVKEKTQ